MGSGYNGQPGLFLPNASPQQQSLAKLKLHYRWQSSGVGSNLGGCRADN